MARAAVKAKQAQQAQAAAAKPARKQRKHASGGNPSQDLFFVRLRRRQKWVFLVLAVVFAISFTALGVGSGTGGGLGQIFSGILGGGSDAVGKAQGEIKTDPVKGYKDLATAYIAKSDYANAIAALNNYLQIKKKDSATWTQAGVYETTQANTYAGQYQQVVQAAEIQSPSSVFVPTGTLGTQLGTNAIDQYYSTANQALSGPLYQNAIAGFNAALTDFQNAAKYAKHSDLAGAEQAVATAAQNVGNTKLALKAWRRYIELSPNSPNIAQIEAKCKQQLGGSCAPTKKTRHKKK